MSLLDPLKPYLYGILALAALSGWAFGGYQTLRYVSERADHAATKAQVAIDANKAAEEVIQALQAAHAEEIQGLLDQMNLNKQAAADARAENTRLMSRLGRFEREMETLRNEPETAAYLATPVPGAVREHGLRAQHRHQAKGGEDHEMEDGQTGR